MKPASMFLFLLLHSAVTSFRPSPSYHSYETRSRILPSTMSIASLVESGAAVAAVVAIHEAGHFFAARSFNMKIDSYNVGYGPKLLVYSHEHICKKYQTTPHIN